ncbi:hypothetical protein [Methylobacterium sp. J-090]|uniref:hypothetical protein n=1 Tax=Methylobacterium sp. J-090 TaxID=2836666 RepID=UPI001FB9E47A|nr:hypothetical protein [Methylobacterium sp. J-090]MCJ2080274.1 hypothetical protein [Methylobacterium sp. J-090]
MGRKLNTLEEVQTALVEPEVDQQRAQAQLQQQYLKRIALTLGMTAAELGGHPAPTNAIQPAIALVRQDELVLIQECLDLVKAFAKIRDPQARLRCLEIVCEAAGAKVQ